MKLGANDKTEVKWAKVNHASINGNWRDLTKVTLYIKKCHIFATYLWTYKLIFGPPRNKNATLGLSIGPNDKSNFKSDQGTFSSKNKN